MAQTTTVLITGAKAGIGRNLLSAFAKRPNHFIIAAIRDGPDSAPAKELEALPKGAGSKIATVKYDAGSEASLKDMVSALEALEVTSLDIVIANAGILKQWAPVKESKGEDLLEHFEINTLGPIRLYQGTADLLNKSESTPKFIIISSNLGSNGLMDAYEGMQTFAYGISKAAVNFAAGTIHRQEPKIVVLPMQPGWIATDMGSRAAVWAGMNPNDPPVKVEDSVSGMMQVFDKATKKEHSGRFWNQKGENMPW